MRIRDRRDGGWFWAQNELIDVFQPLIGPLGVGIYIALCRLVPRDPDGRVSLRDVEAASGASRMTAARVIRKLVALGMLGEKKGGVKMPSTFELLDLREAAAVGRGDLERRLAVTESDSLVRNISFPAKNSEPMTVTDRDSSEHAVGNAVVTELSQKRGLSVPNAPGVSLFTEEKNEERERVRAREDVQPFVTQIVLAHPRTLLRHWSEADIPYADRVAVTQAIDVEFERGGCSGRVDAALFILGRVKRIAEEVPQAQWRFLKDLEKFMRLREYRVEPADLINSAPVTASKPRPDANVGKRSEPSAGHAVDYAIDSADNESYWSTVLRFNPSLFRAEAPPWAKERLGKPAA